MKRFAFFLSALSLVILSACGGGKSTNEQAGDQSGKTAEQTDGHKHDHSDEAHKKQEAMASEVAMNNEVQPGDYVEDFELKNLDGGTTSMDDYEEAKGFVLIFSCNHCPYVKASEDRMIALHNKMKPKGYPVVAINSNDTSGGNQADSYENMKIRAQEKGFPFAYLRDKSQEVARRFGAEKTPHVYLVRKDDEGYRVVYTGAIDDNVRNAEKVTVNYVEEAIEALENGQQPQPQTTKAIGCSLKYTEA